MTAYKRSPNISPRLQQIDRKVRDAKLAEIAANQQVLPSTPQAANRQHFLQTQWEYEEGLLLTVAQHGQLDEVQVERSVPDPLIIASRVTHTLKGSRDTKLGKVSKPHGVAKQRGPKLRKADIIIDPQI